MGSGSSVQEVNQLQGANGILTEGVRVQTQFTVEEGGDGRWYAGIIQACYPNGSCKIQYDDGDTWQGPGEDVHLADPPQQAFPIVQGIAEPNYAIPQQASMVPHQFMVQQTMMQQPMAQQPMVQQSMAQQPMFQPMVQQPVAQQPMAQQPMAQQPMSQLSQQPMAQQPMAYQPMAQQSMAQQAMFQPMAQQPMPQQPMVQQPMAQQAMAQQTTVPHQGMLSPQQSCVIPQQGALQQGVAIPQQVTQGALQPSCTPPQTQSMNKDQARSILGQVFQSFSKGEYLNQESVACVLYHIGQLPADMSGFFTAFEEWDGNCDGVVMADEFVKAVTERSQSGMASDPPCLRPGVQWAAFLSASAAAGQPAPEGWTQQLATEFVYAYKVMGTDTKKGIA
jgi:hypothetical protein